MKLTDKTKRPRSIKPDFSTVPEELKNLSQFILWKYVYKDGSWTKIPYTPGGTPASTTNSSTWSGIDECLNILKADASYDGIGFVFSKDDPYVGIDIDGCIDRGVISDQAVDLVSSLDSYTELSPSGTGIHIICKGSIPAAARGDYNGAAVEVYEQGRYFTWTGRIYGETRPIAERTMGVRRVVKEIKSARTATAEANKVERRLASALEKPHIRSLFEGDLSQYDDDHSRADLALCSKLAPYADGNPQVLDKMFRQSKLYREKWDNQHGSDTYGNITINKALESDPLLVGENRTEAFPSSIVGCGSTPESRQSGRFTVDSLWEKVMAFRENGDARGFHPGWDQLERLYRPTLGSLSVLVGVPSAGKSSWIDALTFNMAKHHKWRITMASFESLPIERHINNLCHIFLQKPTYTFLADHATDTEMEEARKNLNEWFNFILPADDAMDIDSLLEYVQDDINEYGVCGFVLDPWTEIDLDLNSGESRAIERGLRKLQQFTRSNELHTWLLVHPTKGSDTYKIESRGPRPTLYSASGSANFRNKADFGLVIHRWEDDTVSLYVDKVRNTESSGAKGSVDFKFDPRRKEYIEEVPDVWEN